MKIGELKEWGKREQSGSLLVADILNVDFLIESSGRSFFTVKMVCNEHGAIFFDAGKQHRDAKTAGISYEDDYEGNALAAIVTDGLIEIRYHKQFADNQVSIIVARLVKDPRLRFMKHWRVTYQGRRLRIDP